MRSPPGRTEEQPMEDMFGAESKLSRHGALFVTTTAADEAGLSTLTSFVSTTPLLCIDVASSATIKVLLTQLTINQVGSSAGGEVHVMVIGDVVQRNTAASGTALTAYSPCLDITNPTAVAAVYVSSVTIAANSPRI